MQRRLPYTEFVEQIAFHRQYPWGDDWQQAGVVAHAACQPHAKKQLKITDFMPKPPTPPQSPEYIMGFFKGLAEEQQRAKQGRNGK